MKKPDKTKRPPSAEAADQPTQDTSSRKAAAEPGVVASTPIPPGDGNAAASSGGDVRPVKSTLLGDGTEQNPPAARKLAASGSTGDLGSTGEQTSLNTPFGGGKAKGALPDPGARGQTGSDAGTGPSGQDGTPARPGFSGAASSAAAPSRKAPGRRSGFWPVFLGGVAAAGLGSVATIWALPHLPAGWIEQDEPQAVTPAPEVDVDAIRAEAVSAAEAAAETTARATAQSTAESVVDQQIAVLREELAAQQPAPQPAPTDAASTDTAPAPSRSDPASDSQPPQQPAEPAAPAAPAVSAEEVAALRERLDQQAAQIRELRDRPQIDPALAQRVETLAGQADTLEQQIQTAAQAAQQQINEAQAEAERLQQAAAESTRRAEAVAAVAALQSALDRGVTPQDARQALEGAGLETPDALTREVPSLDSLQAGFPDAARAALRTSLREDSTAGNGNLITNFLRAQTGARSVAPREGDDPDAVLSRADAAVQAGRIGDAVAEIESLPEPARAAPAMADWLAGAVAYRDAQAALSDLSVPSN